MKITSFFALSAFALLSIPAVAQQTPENPPPTTEDHIILLDDVAGERDRERMIEIDGSEVDMDALRREIEAARIHVDSVRVMIDADLGETMLNVEKTIDSVRVMIDGMNLDAQIDAEMSRHFYFNSDEGSDSPEETRREELRDRYDGLRDEMKKVQRELRERQRELRKARRDGSADTARISAGIEEAQRSLTSAQQSLETFEKEYGDQIAPRFRGIAPQVRFRMREGADTADGNARRRVIIRNGNGSDEMIMVPMAPMPPMPPMAPMAPIPPMPPMAPMPPMPPMAPMPRMNGALSHGGNMMHFEGDTMIVREHGDRRIVIIRDSANGHSNVIINGGTAVGGDRVRVQTHTIGGGEGGTVIVNGDTLARGGSSHVVIITRGKGENAPTIRERRRVETDVRTKPAPTTPTNLGYTLEDAVPNPFDQNAKISFTLPTPGKVTLTVFNEGGEVIRKLVDQDMAAGAHSIDFDGSGLPTGIYLYQLVAGGFSETKSMRLVR